MIIIGHLHLSSRLCEVASHIKQLPFRPILLYYQRNARQRWHSASIEQSKSNVNLKNKTSSSTDNSPVITFCLYSASQVLVERTAACLTSFSSFCDSLQYSRSIRTHKNAHIRSIKACPPRTLKTFAMFATLVKKPNSHAHSL